MEPIWIARPGSKPTKELARAISTFAVLAWLDEAQAARNEGRKPVDAMAAALPLRNWRRENGARHMPCLEIECAICSVLAFMHLSQGAHPPAPALLTRLYITHHLRSLRIEEVVSSSRLSGI
jgi:hypothetical protein